MVMMVMMAVVVVAGEKVPMARREASYALSWNECGTIFLDAWPHRIVHAESCGAESWQIRRQPQHHKQRLEAAEAQQSSLWHEKKRALHLENVSRGERHVAFHGIA
jgi:hypothetical protein